MARPNGSYLVRYPQRRGLFPGALQISIIFAKRRGKLWGSGGMTPRDLDRKIENIV